MLFTGKKSYLILLAVIALVAGLGVQAQAAPVLSDIQGHWAEQTIKALADQGIINGYPDGTFKPDQAINRAELAKLVAKTFKYAPVEKNSFPDAANHWAQPFINEVASQKIMKAFNGGSFKPSDTVNRAQLTMVLTRILHIATPEEKFSEQWPASFTDLPADHWAFRYAELTRKLEVLPEGFKTEFHPDQGTTRAEAAWALKALNELSVKKGKIASVDFDSGLVNIQGKDDPLLAMVNPDTVLLRNNITASVDTLLAGDEVTAIAVPSGDVKYLKAFGQVTKNDLLSRVSSMTKGQLTTDQISAIVAGDWDSIKDDLKGGLYNRMIGMGLTPAEAESIMVQDWNYLDTLSQDRLAQALSSQFGITQDFSQALLARDVEKIKEYGKIELATAALSRLLGAAEPANNDTEGNY